MEEQAETHSKMERERTPELRGQQEGRRDEERKDIDFHLKEAISASWELQGLSVYLHLCVRCVYDLSWDHNRDWRHWWRHQAHSLTHRHTT